MDENDSFEYQILKDKLEHQERTMAEQESTISSLRNEIDKIQNKVRDNSISIAIFQFLLIAVLLFAVWKLLDGTAEKYLFRTTDNCEQSAPRFSEEETAALLGEMKLLNKDNSPQDINPPDLSSTDIPENSIPINTSSQEEK